MGETSAVNGKAVRQSGGGALPTPPAPREHGAWVMLYAPMVTGFAVSPATDWWRYIVLAGASFAVMFLREAVTVAQRKNWRRADAVWVAIYGFVALGFGALLAASANGPALAIPVILAALIFAVHTGLSALPLRKRFDRSTAGEILGVSAASLAAPAAMAVASGHVTTEGWTLAAAFWVYFSGRILHVNMLLDAAKRRSDFTSAVAARVARPLMTYDAVLVSALAWAVAMPASRIWGVLGFIALAPSLCSSLVQCRRLGERLPSLKRVGLQETIFAIWVALVVIFAHIVAHPL